MTVMKKTRTCKSIRSVRDCFRLGLSREAQMKTYRLLDLRELSAFLLGDVEAVGDSTDEGDEDAGDDEAEEGRGEDEDDVDVNLIVLHFGG